MDLQKFKIIDQANQIGDSIWEEVIQRKHMADIAMQIVSASPIMHEDHFVRQLIGCKFPREGD